MQRKQHNRIFTYVAGVATVAIAAAMIAIGAPAASAAKSVTITGVITSFTPNVITATPGEQVTITLKNGDAAIPHDLTIPTAGNFQIVVAGGASATKVLTAPTAPGDYKFICSIAGHEQAGMVGTLRVAAAGGAAPAPAPGGGAPAPAPGGGAPQADAPAGGVQTGGGSTAGLTDVNVLMLGGGLLIAAMMSALLGLRITRKD